MVDLRTGIAAAVIATAAFSSLSSAASPAEDTLPADAVAARDVVYVTRPGGPVMLDLFTPPGAGPFPVVLWIHGGAWKMGSKSTWSHMNFLVGEGYAVANVEYRFTPVAPFPAQLDDCTAALDFVAEHAGQYRLDVTRIAVTGESAGGHLASLLGMARPAGSTASGPGRVRAVIDLFGPSDIARLAEAPKVGHELEELVGGPLATHGDVAKAASPMAHVAKDAPPFLILHGTEDPLVPFAQSQMLADALKAAGVPVELVPVQKAGHAGPAFWVTAMREKMMAFLKTNLRS